jgi:hypothetical protein
MSLIDNAAASAIKLPCLQLPTPEALIRSGDIRGHIQRGISRILRARAYFDMLTLCKPSPFGLYAGDFLVRVGVLWLSFRFT